MFTNILCGSTKALTLFMYSGILSKVEENVLAGGIPLEAILTDEELQRKLLARVTSGSTYHKKYGRKL